MWLTLVRKAAWNLHELASLIKDGKVMINRKTILYLILLGMVGTARPATQNWIGPVDIKEIYVGSYKVELAIDESKTPLPCERFWGLPPDQMLYLRDTVGYAQPRPDRMLALLLAGQSQDLDIMIRLECGAQHGIPYGFVYLGIKAVRLVK